MKLATELCVTDCMTKQVVSVGKDTRLIEAIWLMEEKCLSALPVVDQTGCICGMLSTSDLISLTYQLQCDVTVLPHVSASVRESLTNALAEDNESMLVSDAMATNVATVSGETRLNAAARMLIETASHHLPVVDESGKPVGLISTTDIVRAFANSAAE